MADYVNRLPDRPVHEARTPLSVVQELTEFHMRFFTHQAHNARAFYADYWNTVRGARGLRPLDAYRYSVDAAQRSLLFWDIIRERGNRFIAHEAAGNPPVLKFTFETVVDGSKLARPVNYDLVRILPQYGYEIDAKKRPFVIVDPRAGHGAGIGGFKQESQVGVALEAGHPVYFVTFKMHPEPGQTVNDVARAEKEFLDWVVKEHPQSDKPCVLGNCQGGWAVMAVAAANPDLTGPVVLSGAPLSYWAGVTGKNPMRYLGGLIGGAWMAYMISDLGNGEFDGANLVLNFEGLDLANSLWSKYYNLYAKADTEAERFLDFELWWGGYMFMTSDEMRAILDNLFIGNKLSRGEISVGKDLRVDLRRIQQPIIIFCSVGDNITPPQQALNWIADLYDDEREIKAAGQVIVYLMHQTTGHLGIFVSGAVVGREHQQIAKTLQQIESLPPGLYEMTILDNGTASAPTFEVMLEERTIEQLLEQGGTRMGDDAEFEIVKLISEFNGKAYEMFASPFLRAISNSWSAEMLRRFHPLRVQHWAFSDLNPLLMPLQALTGFIKNHRLPVPDDNPFVVAEQAHSKRVEYLLNTLRDTRDITSESLFYAIYGTLDAVGFAKRLVRQERRGDEERNKGDLLAQSLVDIAPKGDFIDAVMRILLLLTHARGHLTRSEIDMLHERLTENAEFARITPQERREKLRRQTVLVAYQPKLALETLTSLLPTADERRKALTLLDRVEGIEKDAGAKSRAVWAEIQSILGAKPASLPRKAG